MLSTTAAPSGFSYLPVALFLMLPFGLIIVKHKIINTHKAVRKCSSCKALFNSKH